MIHFFSWRLQTQKKHSHDCPSVSGNKNRRGGSWRGNTKRRKQVPRKAQCHFQWVYVLFCNPKLVWNKVYPDSPCKILKQCTVEKSARTSSSVPHSTYSGLHLFVLCICSVSSTHLTPVVFKATVHATMTSIERNRGKSLISCRFVLNFSNSTWKRF